MSDDYDEVDDDRDDDDMGDDTPTSNLTRTEIMRLKAKAKKEANEEFSKEALSGLPFDDVDNPCVRLGATLLYCMRGLKKYYDDIITLVVEKDPGTSVWLRRSSSQIGDPFHADRVDGYEGFLVALAERFCKEARGEDIVSSITSSSGRRPAWHVTITPSTTISTGDTRRSVRGSRNEWHYNPRKDNPMPRYRYRRSDEVDVGQVAIVLMNKVDPKAARRLQRRREDRAEELFREMAEELNSDSKHVKRGERRTRRDDRKSRREQKDRRGRRGRRRD